MIRKIHQLLAFSAFVAFLAGADYSLAAPRVSDGAAHRLVAGTSTLTIPFIANEGQADRAIKFHTPFLGGEVRVTEQGGITYAFPSIALTEWIVGGSGPVLRGEGRAPTQVNYYLGNNPAAWHEDIPAYASVAFGEVYPGISLRLRAAGSNVEKIFTLEPGARVHDIRIAIDGASALRALAGGELEADTAHGPVRFTPPLAYQEIDGHRRNVAVAYRVAAQHYGFTLGAYDSTRPVVIDPLLASTFLNGPSFNHWGMDFAPAAKRGGSRSIYLAGDLGIPPGFEDEDQLPPDTPLDNYVARLDATLSVLEAYTVYGSPNFADVAGVMLVHKGKSEQDFSVYVAGRTYGADFPVTAGAYDTSHNSATPVITADGYVARFSPDLKLLVATFIGGGNEETQSHWLDFDAQDNVYFGGKTASTDFPTTAGAYDRTYNGGVWDAYVAKMSPDLSTLLAATLFGGSQEDVTRSARLDSYGNLIFTGQTLSPDIPTTPGAYDRTFHGDRDFYVAKVNKDFSKLLAATYVGASDTDFPSYLRIDRYGYVNIVGYSKSPDFPTTPGVYDTTLAGLFDGVIVRLNSTLSKLVSSTFFGGSDVDLAFTFDMDPSGNFYITGRTRSQDYPTTAGAYDRIWNGDFDAMVTVISYDMKTLLSSTYIGGSNLDMAFAIRWDSGYNVYVAGVTASPEFPTTAGAYDTTFVPANTAFAFKMDMTPGSGGQ